jgi:hypothetical protein
LRRLGFRSCDREKCARKTGKIDQKPCITTCEGRRKKEEGRRKKEEGRRKKEEGRRKKEENTPGSHSLAW